MFPAWRRWPPDSEVVPAHSGSVKHFLAFMCWETIGVWPLVPLLLSFPFTVTQAPDPQLRIMYSIRCDNSLGQLNDGNAEAADTDFNR